MIKEIKYGGFTAQPSDYECQDGDLAASINLIPEDGGQIRTIRKPSVALSLRAGERVFFIHKVPGQVNYILARDVAGGYSDLFWIEQDPKDTVTDKAKFILSLNQVLDIDAVGNTIVIATTDGIKYLLWRDGDYISLGSKPPFISIDFGMCRIGTIMESKKCPIPARCSPRWSAERGGATKAELASMTEAVYSLLNSAIADTVTSCGRFYQPFFVRYAYRLYDGTHSWHSAPILMLPSVIPPIIKYSDDGSSPQEEGTLNATFQLNVEYFELAYRILTDCVADLTKWEDLIKGIDVFISAPIYTYDQSKDLTGRTVTNIRSMLLSLYDWAQEGDSLRGENATTPPSAVFVGHYADNSGSKYIDHTMSTAVSDGYDIVNIKQHEHFHDNIRSSHNFYKVAEIDIKDITPMTSMSRLKLTDKDLTPLVAREVMSDDFQSHCKISASSLYAFNSRINLAGVIITPPEPFTLRSSTQFSNPDGLEATNVRITVWTRLNGVRCHAVHAGSHLEEDMFYNPSGNFPRYIFYPDASAYKMEVFIDSKLKYIINLTPHDFLNGAYYYSGNFSPDPTPESAEPETEQSNMFVNVRSKIYTSEVNNPFVFPALGINTVGSGDVIRLCSAAKALSQGQFGQFPLYAFTTEGVWALELTSTGSYAAKQPISRDVCTNPDGITQIDSAVLFPTDRGIMLISGSNTTCISDSINNDYPFDIRSLPGIETLHTMLDHSADTCLPLQSFTQFLKQCRMIYDYVHQRIIVYNEQYTYAYVYSLKTKMWGMMYSEIRYNVNSYPEALAVTTDGKMVNFAKTDGEQINGLLVTRPLKLDAADVLKTVDTIIQRGNFQKGHVQSVLYGSRDLYNWSLVWSSKDHYLRGFRGTPYKYFRIALLCFLTEDESIFGASVQFTPRLTNQLR